MIIDCISDLHGQFPKLPGGDLLIVAGDLTARDSKEEYYDFFGWLHDQKYDGRIVVGGNHDNWLQKNKKLFIEWSSGSTNIKYLEDSGVKFDEFKIWGSPWTAQFQGENPRCLAFTCGTDKELDEKWACIPKDTDILITHSPPHGTLDRVKSGKMVGSLYLENRTRHLSLKLHIFGHIHESHGIMIENGTTYVNASVVDEKYRAVNAPMRIFV